MASLTAAVLDIQRLDLLARADTPVHRLDARAKVLVTIVYCATVVSFSRYELSALLPFLFFPVVMIALGNLPPLFIVRKIVLVSPFVLTVAIFNPLLDRGTVLYLGSFAVSGGWLSFASILIRFALTVGAGLVLVGTTGFSTICQALERLGVPRAFVIQLQFLYRYLFVLAEEGGRMARARELRSCGRRGQGIRSYGSLVGHLLLRTWQRAERVHMSMLARCFTGQFNSLRPARFGWRDGLFLAGWCMLFAVLRRGNFSRLAGEVLAGLLS